MNHCKTLTSFCICASSCVHVTVITQWPAEFIHIYKSVPSFALYCYVLAIFISMFSDSRIVMHMFMQIVFIVSFLNLYNFAFSHFLLPSTYALFVLQVCYFYTHDSRGKIALLRSKSISPQLILPLHTLRRC